jgi:hypothetical protein
MAWCLVKQRDNFTFTFRGEYDIKMDLQEVVWEGVDLMHLAQDQWRDFLKTAMNIRFP